LEIISTARKEDVRMGKGMREKLDAYKNRIVRGVGKSSKDEISSTRSDPVLSTSLKIFGSFFRKHNLLSGLDSELKKSKIGLSRVQYLSLASFYTILFILAVLVLSVLVYAVSRFDPAIISAVAFLAILLWGAGLIYYPTNVSHTRRRDIDAKLPMAIGYISAMASADIPIDRILSDLGKLELYGEISKEANSISVMTNIFGMDILEAIKEASRFSPSRKFSEFLSGIGTTVNSGGNLKDYLIGKARQYNSELTIGIKRNVESIGVLAESFITVGVAFPLMLMIIVGVIAVLAPSPPVNLILFLVFIVAIIIPAITAVFTIFIRSTLREVEF
jgi:flagellar protein FlaJ